MVVLGPNEQSSNGILEKQNTIARWKKKIHDVRSDKFDAINQNARKKLEIPLEP